MDERIRRLRARACQLAQGEDFEGDPLSSGVTTQRRARPVLDLIGRLYAVEAEVPTVGLDATADDSAAARALRARLRANQSRGIVGEIRAWALGQRVLPESSLGKAIRYMLGLWPGLTRFLADPRIPIDNNHTERSLRGVVLGRRIHYGSRSQRGTQAAALFYSLIESAKLVGVGPKAYLLQAVREALVTPGSVTLPPRAARLTAPLPLSRHRCRAAFGSRVSLLSSAQRARRSPATRKGSDLEILARPHGD